MASAREHQTATLLRHPSGLRPGHVLVAGGYSTASGSSLATAEVYEPAANTWTATGAMAAARDRHAASSLPDGRVLVAGGYSTIAGGSIASAETYDPTTNLWGVAAAMSSARWSPTATALPGGPILLAGGFNTTTGLAVATAELYNAGTNTWSPAGSMATGRYRATATPLSDGRVLVAGGLDSAGNALHSAEIYSPSTNSWTIAPSMTDARERHTATMLPNGEVMVAGGTDGLGNALDSVEAFDAGANNWTVKMPMTTPRYAHAAARLNDGNVLVAGGRTTGGAPVDAAELYLYATDIWTNAGPMLADRSEHTGTLTRLTSGAVLVAGGNDGASSTAAAELYGGVMWTAAASMSTVRNSHIAQLLTVGGTEYVLVAGGFTYEICLVPTVTAELYNTATNSWSSAGSMSFARGDSRTALTAGRVLVTGGTVYSYSEGCLVSPVANVDLYDPATNTWATGPSLPPSLSIARYRHTATTLPNGKVLVAGGNVPGPARTATTAIYDPGSNSWSPGASMSVARADHTATLLPSGDVLVAGGYTFPITNTAEIYDPDTDTWSPAASMNYNHWGHTATALGDGRVIVASGNDGMPPYTADLYDPVANSWSASGMGRGYIGHSAALPLSGRALVTGYSSGEVFVPAAIGPAEWFRTPNMLQPLGRTSHTSTAIPAGPAAGDVLLTGGRVGSTLVATSSAELYHSSLESIWVCYAVDAVEDCDADTVRNAVDNCPAAWNPGQTNSDAGPPPPASKTGTIDNGPGIAGGDTTLPNDDGLGDACDSDLDNDGLANGSEAPLAGCGAFNGAAPGHPSPTGGDSSNDDNGDGVAAPPMGVDGADNGPSSDTDNDGVLDGEECALGFNPRDRLSTPTAALCGGAVDADADGLTLAMERCKWGTSDAVIGGLDSDSDGKKDCTEANDTNGDGFQNFPNDTINSAKAANNIIGKTQDFDLNGDGFVNFPGDTILSAKMASHVVDGGHPLGHCPLPP